MRNKYKRQRVGKYIIKALQALGGSASRQAIKEEIAADESIDISYENIFIPIKSKNGTLYVPFIMDFNFDLVNLHTCGYIEDYKRGDDITLTELGRIVNYDSFPNSEDQEEIDNYWEKKKQDRVYKKKSKNESTENLENSNEIAQLEDTYSSNNDMVEEYRAELLERIKSFSPKKFESFSRLLLSHMGIKFDREKGVKMSGDHGIDGFGYFQSDEFRTSKVVIQCKRFVEQPISEPVIDQFKGVMTSFNADYGIFITTSYFTKQAQEKALQGSNIVTLIDGQKLVSLIEKYQLHILPVQVYILDDYYYEKE